MKTINCKNGSFSIDDRTLSFLNIYKGGGSENDVKVLFPNLKIYSPYYVSSLRYENINLFMNFLNNPREIPINKLEIDHFDVMIEMIKSLIDLSCNYALNNGEIEGALYRYEDNRNMNGYSNHILTSLKSTSNRPRTIDGLFKDENKIALKYKAYGFCPYIKVEDVLEDCEFSNESEYLFPPFIKCNLSEEYEDDPQHTAQFRVIHIKDDYLDKDNNDLESSFNTFNSIKNRFQIKYIEDRRNGIVSDELCSLVKYVQNYLNAYARNKYREFNEYYQKKYASEDKTYTFWGEKYRGFEEAMIKYFSDYDSEKSWLDDKTLHVYILSELVDNGFIPLSILPSLYSSSEATVLEYFLKNRNDDSGFRSLTDKEYDEFISNFNIIAGYGNKDYPVMHEEKIAAANRLMCMDYIENKSSTLN